MSLWTSLNRGRAVELCAVTFGKKSDPLQLVLYQWKSSTVETCFLVVVWNSGELHLKKADLPSWTQASFERNVIWVCVAYLQEVAFKQQCSVTINICMKGRTSRIWILYFIKFAMTELSFQSCCLSFIRRINCTPRTSEQRAVCMMLICWLFPCHLKS